MKVGVFRCEQAIIQGDNYAEIVRKARRIYHGISRQTKRNPFVRAPFFGKEKVFLNSFWSHLNTKRQKDRMRRLRFYGYAIELIQGSRIQPQTLLQSKSETIFRFVGISGDGQQFFVQIRLDIKTDRKHFTSVFPFD